MGNPIGHGVLQGLRRRRGEAPPPRPASPLAAWFYFVAITMSLSWITAALLGGPRIREGDPLALRLFWASVYYAVTMGWQPLVGAWIARAIRPAPGGAAPAPRRLRARDLGLAVLVGVGLAGAAMLLAWGLGEPAPSAAVEPSLAAAGALGVLCVQAFTEEYGWRGFPLTCAVERWGDPGGLVVHGIAWGVWYAPLFLVPGGAPADAGAFVVTCLLLGVVFGWMRLRSGSVVPSALANAVLTIVAGLPLLVQAGSLGARDAIFRMPGWPVLALCAAAVVVISARSRSAGPPPPRDRGGPSRSSRGA
jgi:membrane protease YdiL (CAAX protease family)